MKKQMFLLSIILLLLGCQHSQEVKEENLDDALITKYYYKLDDTYLRFAACQGEDTQANREKMIDTLSENGRILTFIHPCNGVEHQVGYYKQNKVEILILNDPYFGYNSEKPNAGLTIFNISNDSIKPTEKIFITIEEEEVRKHIKEKEAFSSYREEFGENIPLSLLLIEDAVHLVVHPEFNTGPFLPLAAYEFKEGKFH